MTMSFPGEDGRRQPGFEDEDDIAGHPDPREGDALRPHPDRKFDQFEGTGELDLGEEDVRLPWLEGDDEDDYDDRRAGNGQLVALVLVGLVALALIVGVIWWMQRDRPDETLVADGETIAAPKTPYKTKPENPGGEVVAGTGDTSFAVAEGQTRQVRMGNDDTPAPAPKASASTSPSPSASASGEPAQEVSGVGVQVGAYSNRDAAEKGWTKLAQQYEALGSVKHRIVEGRADIGTVYRLQAVPGDAGAANRLCGTLKAAGLSCQVKR